MTDDPINVLKKVISRVDDLSMFGGRLLIVPKNGKPVPEKWFTDNERTLIIAIIRITEMDAYAYTGYSTGFYGKYKSAGVTLQFANIDDGSEAHAIFNAVLTRTKNTVHGKAGADLPKGKFNVLPKSLFYKFFLSANHGKQIRKASFCEHMGNLKQVIFTGTLNLKSKIQNKSLQPFNVSFDQIIVALNQQNAASPSPINSHQSTGNSRASYGQATGNSRLSVTVNESALTHTNSRIEANQTTCKERYDKSLQGDRLISNALASNSSLDTTNNEPIKNMSKNQTSAHVVTPIKSTAEIQNQSIEEWSENYDRAV
jgi:hypothetical protein